MLHIYPTSIDEITEKILRTLVMNPPVTTKFGGMIASGVSVDLDNLKNDLVLGSVFGVADRRDKTLPNILVKLEEDERKRTGYIYFFVFLKYIHLYNYVIGISTLKIIESKSFGFVISIPRKSSKASTLPKEYDLRQTLTNEERYSTPTLIEIENKIMKASEEIIKIENAIYLQLKEETASLIPTISSVTEIISAIDVIASFAQRAVDDNYVRPEIMAMSASREISIVNGRHPVVESILSSTEFEFVPNSLIMGRRDENLRRKTTRGSYNHNNFILEKVF